MFKQAEVNILFPPSNFVKRPLSVCVCVCECFFKETLDNQVSIVFKSLKKNTQQGSTGGKKDAKICHYKVIRTLKGPLNCKKQSHKLLLLLLLLSDTPRRMFHKYGLFHMSIIWKREALQKTLEK